MDQIKVGRWAFVIGLIVSILLGFISFAYSSLILVILGLIVGFLNVTEKEASKFLIAVIAMIVIGIAGLQSLSFLGTLLTWVETVLISFTLFVAASGLVVALKVLFEVGKNE